MKFIVGGTSTAKQDKNNNAVQALAVTKKDAKNDLASYVILLAATDFNNAGSDDVVYVHEQSNAKVSYTDADGKVKTGYDTELYFLDGSGKVESVTVAGSAKAAGFYTWELNDDKVYELTATTPAGASSISGSSYDDETIAVTNATLDGIYKNALSIAKESNKTLNDVDFASNVIIRDNRNASTRDASVYTSKIESVSALKSAIDRSNDKNDPVEAVVYYDNGEVIMVYVTAVAKASNTGSSNTDTTATVTGVSAAAGVKDGELDITVTADAGTVASKASVTLSVLNNAGTWTELNTYVVDIAANATSGSHTVTGLNSGVQYKVVCGDYSAFGTAR